MLQARSNLPRFHGAALKVAREYRRWTKKELAAAAGCHKEQISRVEAGAQPELLLREAFVEALPVERTVEILKRYGAVR